MREIFGKYAVHTYINNILLYVVWQNRFNCEKQCDNFKLSLSENIYILFKFGLLKYYIHCFDLVPLTFWGHKTVGRGNKIDFKVNRCDNVNTQDIFVRYSKYIFIPCKRMFYGVCWSCLLFTFNYIWVLYRIGLFLSKWITLHAWQPVYRVSASQSFIAMALPVLFAHVFRLFVSFY